MPLWSSVYGPPQQPQQPTPLPWGLPNPWGGGYQQQPHPRPMPQRPNWMGQVPPVQQPGMPQLLYAMNGPGQQQQRPGVIADQVADSLYARQATGIAGGGGYGALYGGGGSGQPVAPPPQNQPTPFGVGGNPYGGGGTSSSPQSGGGGGGATPFGVGGTGYAGGQSQTGIPPLPPNYGYENSGNVTGLAAGFMGGQQPPPPPPPAYPRGTITRPTPPGGGVRGLADAFLPPGFTNFGQVMDAVDFFRSPAFTGGWIPPELYSFMNAQRAPGGSITGVQPPPLYDPERGDGHWFNP